MVISQPILKIFNWFSKYGHYNVKKNDRLVWGKGWCRFLFSRRKRERERESITIMYHKAMTLKCLNDRHWRTCGGALGALAPLPQKTK